MKLFILFGIISLANSLSDSTDLAKDFCAMSGLCKPGTQSIACSFTSNLSMGCVGNMVPIDKNLILSVHNGYRQKIANGEYAPQYQGATNMAEMKYSEELEIMASYNARRCVFAHDDCRKTNNFPYAGQNIAIAQKWNTDIDTKADIKEMMDDWFSEYKDCDMSFIDNYHKTTLDIGHFTQMVKDKAVQVGCAASSYVENGWNTLLLVCNYAYTNMLDEPTYVAGSPGTACRRRSKKYPALCAA
ncbi:venom allergen 5-like [Condylostylus longicornis]|uniref:venom allergen 5-like n=1 Tax=Condylostylus longicornis TaxID=2530218 RepID=UPI00244DDBA1|nr:venom allergen 5-like [Condylostylus longicornis]